MNCRLVFRVILVLLIARLVYNKDDPHVFHNTEKDVRESNLPFFQNGYFKLTAAFSYDAAEELLKVFYLELKALSLATLLTTIPFGYLLGWLFLKAVGYKDKEKERLLLKVTEYRKLCMKLERDVNVHRRARLNIRNDLGRANARLAKLARENKLPVADNNETFRDVEILMLKAEAFKSERKLGSALKETAMLKEENAKSQSKLKDALDELSEVSDNEATVRVELALAKAKLDIMNQQASKFEKETIVLKGKAAKTHRQFQDAETELALAKAKLDIMDEQALKFEEEVTRLKLEKKNMVKELEETNNEVINLFTLNAKEITEAYSSRSLTSKRYLVAVPCLGNQDKVARSNDEREKVKLEFSISKKEVSRLKRENEEIVKEQEAIKNELARSNVENEKREVQLTKAMEELNKVNNAVMQRDKELIVVKSELNKVNNAVMQKDKELIIAKSKITSLNDEAANMKKKLAYANNKIASLNNDIDRKVKELANALNEVLQTRKKDCNNCKMLRKLNEKLRLECETEDKFRRAQLNKVRLQADVHLQMVNDHKWQNDVLRQRLNGLTLQSAPYKPP
ncbi:hypothetical protein ACROYT_G015711 [Oculina patagonica]